jgi:DNA-binding CsgD family transcriptional regulator
MLSGDDHDRLVSQFYSSAMGDTPWTATLGCAADLFGSSASLIQVQDSSKQAVVVENHGYSREFSDSFYASEAFANDPRVACFQNLRPGSVYFDHMLYDVEEMNRNRWCRESCDILKVKYQLGAVLSLPNDATAGFAILSSPKEGHASEAAIAAFRRLSPHIQQACALGHVIETQAATRAILLDALARKSDGVILLGRNAKPTFMNDVATAILNTGDGISHTAGGGFVARRMPETRKLQRLIQDTVIRPSRPDAGYGGHMLVTRPSGKRPYVLRVIPAPATERFLASQTIVSVIHIQDLAAVPLPSGDALCQTFGLTERETVLAIELVRSADLGSAAMNAHMAYNTARNHLHGIFRKTGSKSQAELLQVLGRLH